MKKNISGNSINDKIAKLAHKLGTQDVNKVRIIVSIERLIARLMTRNFLRENMIFGGGFVMIKTAASNRFTKDLDAIIKRVSNKKLNEEITAALDTDLGDGFHFWGITHEIMDMKSGYNGVRYSFYYKTGEPPKDKSSPTRERKIQLDVSIDFSLGRPPIHLELKSALDLYEPLSWSVYPHEYIIADKLHALISREGESTRAKDIYDLSILLPKVTNVPELMAAIEFIFNTLKTDIPNSLHSEISSYDTSRLHEIWLNKVDINEEISFSDSWARLLENLKRIDKQK